MEQALTELKQRLGEIYDLRRAAAVLGWDQHVMMPPAGAPARAAQLATLQQIAHEKFISDETGRLLDSLRDFEESLDYDSDDASLIRVTRVDWEKARRVPPELAAERTRAAAEGYGVWVQARQQSDFGMFLPVLRRNLDLTHRYVECFEPADETYDVLLDDYERGMKTADVRAVFSDLRAELPPLIEAASERADAVDDSCLRGDFPVERQKEFELRVLDRFGFEPESWRIDPTVHPFMTSFSIPDIRITTRYFSDRYESLFGTMHEFGHGLYERQVDPALERTPLARGTSMALHESQSRMWENLVGRSRPFWRFFYPQLQQTFPEALGSVDEETFWRAVNKIQPTLIRVEADEVTYNLHIVLRFELEQDLLERRVELDELPEVWDARMRELLGIEPPDVAQGVLQDVHWSAGSIGYFPTYALGNVVSAQLWERAAGDVPGLEDGFAEGEFAPLRDWLRENLHRHGRKFTPGETLERVVGGGIEAGPYIRYLHRKVGEVYGVGAAAPA